MKLVIKFDASPSSPRLNGSKSFCIHHNILLTDIRKSQEDYKKMQQQKIYIHW